MKKLILITSLLIFLSFTTGTGIFADSPSAPASLKLGIFTDADSFPFLICEAERIFQEENVNVELVRFQSAIERDSAFHAGSIDGIISDLCAAVLARQGGFKVRITSLTDGRFGIVAGPGIKAKSLADLAKKPIGISSNTIIHYMVDSYMKNAGIQQANISLMPIPKLPVRLELLLSGQIAAAGMTEPFITMALVKGSTLLASTDEYPLGAGVLVFHERSIEEKTEAIKRLYQGYWEAAQRINAKPDSYRSLLAQKAGFSEEAARAFRFITYQKPRLPAQEDIRHAEAWLLSKNLLKTEIAPSELVDGRFTAGW